MYHVSSLRSGIFYPRTPRWSVPWRSQWVVISRVAKDAAVIFPRCLCCEKKATAWRYPEGILNIWDSRDLKKLKHSTKVMISSWFHQENSMEHNGSTFFRKKAKALFGAGWPSYFLERYWKVGIAWIESLEVQKLMTSNMVGDQCRDSFGMSYSVTVLAVTFAHGHRRGHVKGSLLLELSTSQWLPWRSPSSSVFHG